ncbi:hypothetical protein D9619_009335 [Psilocybe cf. subviscida]|uniref:Uncharacterized protein n=1 Tax=Psilocybe cf. subviscida TaxID=2480587 RepID=A0A8H5BV65_9AGAR|nr:hypothetical protein D9619_009335 [Psilocybe cf. subviscida]
MLLYLTGNTVIQMMPAGHCNVAIHVVTSPLFVAVPASQLLLYLHVRAIYATERVVVWFFSLMWISTLVSVVISASSIYGINLGPTNYCTPHTDAHTALGIISILVNDTLLFIALVARIMGTSTQDAHTSAWPLKDRFKTALLGASIPRLAKTLLQKGQQYILVTVIANMAALVMFYADGGNLSLGFANIMLMNLMASRLYRSTKLSRYDELNVSFELSLPPSRPILFV